MRNHIGVYGILDDGSRFSPDGNTHDHGIASVRGGKCTAIELERHTRVKHDNRLGNHITDLLPKLVQDEDDVKISSVNSFLGSGFSSSDGRFVIRPRDVPIMDIARSTDCIIDGMSVEAEIVSHEFAHIASCLPFTGDFKENSLLVHIDGGASDSSSSAWVWESERPRFLKASWDELKHAANNFNINPLAQSILGLTSEDHLSMPGKLMGYASYGHPNPELEGWLRDNGWFLQTEDRSELLREINGFFDTSMESFDMRRQELMDVAYAIQHGFETDIMQYLSDLKKRTGCERLYYAGGAALNINANSRIVKELGFEDVFIPPCAGDSGLAIGAAAWSAYRESEPLSIETPFLGMETTYSESSSAGDVADMVAAGKAIGLFTGRSEIGPRALGHRSIIARPDDVDLRIRVSEVLKRREWYRPVAPVMLENVASEILIGYGKNDHLARFMLGTYTVKEEYRFRLAGIIHADGTIRAQVVSDESEPIHRILKELLDRHGILATMLTSFNSRGEPIVETADDAISCGKAIGLDGVVFL